MGKYLFVGCLSLIILSALLSLITSWIFMLLWNWLIPTIFNGPELTWLQSFGLLFLIHLLAVKITVNKE